ncbi:hypothetical protein NSND_61141 [Nitrospira sp. ND1]|nr:hypothetical protein NSND_61141 [Nitrospira sp. ND1]
MPGHCRGVASTVPQYQGAAPGRYLLCHPEPPECGQVVVEAGRCDSRDRITEQLEFESASRIGRALRHSLLSHRCGVGHQSRLAERCQECGTVRWGFGPRSPGHRSGGLPEASWLFGRGRGTDGHRRRCRVSPSQRIGHDRIGFARVGLGELASSTTVRSSSTPFSPLLHMLGEWRHYSPISGVFLCIDSIAVIEDFRFIPHNPSHLNRLALEVAGVSEVIGNARLQVVRGGEDPISERHHGHRGPERERQK